MNGSDLLKPLAGLRRRARTIMVMHGLIRLASAAVLVALTCMVLDWLLWLPGPLRLATTVCLLGVMGLALWRLVFRPWLRPIDLTEIAVKVQNRFAEFHRGLAGAVEFVEHGPSGSAALTERAVQRAAEVASRVQMNKALAWRMPRRRGLVALFALVTIAAIGGATPGWLHTGALRFGDPLGPHEWPRHVQIEPVSGDAVVALNESFTCEMAVVRGGSERLRATCVTRDDDGHTSEVPLQRGRDGVYRWTFEGLTRGFTYWFEAGDARPSPPSRVRLVLRPAVRTAELVVHAPPYAANLAPTRHVLSDRPVPAIEGSRATLEITTNKPIASGPDSPAGAWLLDDHDNEIALTPRPGDSTAFAAELEINESIAFRVRLVDGEGFDNREPQLYHIEMTRDEAPTMALLTPPPVLEATPTADVALAASAEDDFGIASLTLHAAIEEREPLPPIDLMPAASVTSGPDRVVVHADLLWSLADLDASPGQIVSYHLEARDNFALAGRGHEPVHSRVGRIKIISESELADRFADRLQVMKGRLRQLWTQQETLREELESVRDAVGSEPTLSEAAADSLLRVSGDQTRVAAHTTQTSRQFADLATMLELNRVDDSSSLAQMKRFERRLQEVADNPMKQAAELVAETRQMREPARRADQLAAAGDRQQSAGTVLRELLAELDQWGDLQDVVRKTREMLDRQQRITQATARVTAETVGRRVEDLSTEQFETLKSQTDAQDRLAQDLADLVRKLSSVADGLREKDAASADALTSAEQTARSTAVVERMKLAAQAIRANRGSSAGIDQLAAEKGLQAMLASLENRRSRVLAELTKKLEEAAQTLRALIEEQHELLAANQQARGAADEKERYLAQGRQQDLLKHRTQKLAEQLAASLDTNEVSHDVRRAAPPMERAALRLSEGNGPEAETDQHAALEALTAALERLEEQRRKAEAEMAAKSLLAFREDLVKIRDAQAALNTETQGLAGQVAEAGRLNRLQARNLRLLAGRQREIKDQMSSLRERLSDTVIYDWAARLVIDSMDGIASRLQSRDLSAGTLAAMSDVLNQLDRLIDALLEEGAPPEDQFAAEGGGGGASQQQGPKGPIPTLAELKLLKMLQLDVNQQTNRLGAESESANVSEEALEKVRTLGERQKKIRELAERMIEKTWLHEVK